MAFHEFYSLLPAYGNVFSLTDIIEVLQLIDNKKEFESKSFIVNKRLIQIEWKEENVIIFYP